MHSPLLCYYTNKQNYSIYPELIKARKKHSASHVMGPFKHIHNLQIIIQSKKSEGKFEKILKIKKWPRSGGKNEGSSSPQGKILSSQGENRWLDSECLGSIHQEKQVYKLTWHIRLKMFSVFTNNCFQVMKCDKSISSIPPNLSGVKILKHVLYGRHACQAAHVLKN